MIDDVESSLALGIVDAANVDQAAEAAGRIVAQEFDRGEKLLALDLDGELAKRHAPAGQRGPEAICKISAKLVKGFVHQASRT